MSSYGTMGAVHYIESGVGTPLVLLHAFPVDARMFNGARALLEEHARVITPDQRGFGESPLEGSASSAPSLDAVAGDVIALLDSLGLRRVVLGGCSMGGYVAMSVLRAAPELISGLVLIDTKTSPDTADQRNNRLAMAERAEREGTRGWLADATLPALLGSTTHGRRPEGVERTRELVESQPHDGVAWAQRAMAERPDSSDTLRDFSGPALVVVGAEDTLTPPEAARDMAGLLPDGELQVIRGVGHLSPLEDPEAFAEVLVPWLAKLS